MISVAAIRMQQFGVQFYQASLTAKDIDKLVRFEVLSYGEQRPAGVRGGAKKAPPKSSEGQLGPARAPHRANEKAYQRQIIRKKIDELVQYYEQCRQARDLPSIPGAVIISCDEKLKFEPVGRASPGTLKVPEREGILRAIDGQHRLLALHADIDQFGDEDVHGAGRHLRPPARGPRRPDVRHDQRQAHAAQPVAPRVALGPAALRDEAWPRRTTSCARSTTARTRRSTARSSCSASARAAWRRRRSRRS
jgi:hypothetical protein